MSLGDIASFANNTKDVDIQYQNVLYTLHNQDAVDYANDDELCGYSDWTLDTPKDISGKTCNDFLFPYHGQTEFSIYQMTVADSAKTLLFGTLATSMRGSIPEERQTTLDDSAIYTFIQP